MIINKITVGFVTQKFNTETGQFVSQEFIGSDERTWENEMGDPVDPPQVDGKEAYMHYEMHQPTALLVGHVGGELCIDEKPESDENPESNESSKCPSCGSRVAKHN